MELLGEYVGGLVVRLVCCVLNMYIIVLDILDIGGEDFVVDDSESFCLLIFVGVKCVLIFWFLRNGR